MSKEPKAIGVRPLSSVLKTLAVLDFLGKSDRPIKLQEVARALGESRATMYQKLITLVYAGWLEQTDDGSYRLSLHAVRMGHRALEQAGLGERSIHILQELAYEAHETVSLAVLEGNVVRIIKRVEAEAVIRAQIRVGSSLSLDNSSSGRVLTAYATPEHRELLKRDGETLATDELLHDVQKKGYAISSGKDVPGARSIAAPIFDSRGVCICALSIVAPAERFDSKHLLPHLLKATIKLNGLLSGNQITTTPKQRPSENSSN